MYWQSIWASPQQSPIPFLGVAQTLAGLPLFSGAWFRLIVFAAMYLLFLGFLLRYARRIEKDPGLSPVSEEDQANRERYQHLQIDTLENQAGMRRAMALFLVFLALIFIVLVAAPFVPEIAAYSMPIVGFLFFVGGISAGLASGANPKTILRAAWDGFTGIAPAIPLILMASSITYIVTQGGILDTILYSASQPFSASARALRYCSST